MPTPNEIRRSTRSNITPVTLTQNQLQKLQEEYAFKKAMKNSGMRNTSLPGEKEYSGANLNSKIPHINTLKSPVNSNIPTDLASEYDTEEYYHSTIEPSNNSTSSISNSFTPTSPNSPSLSKGGYKKSRRKPRRKSRQNCHRTSFKKYRKKIIQKNKQ